MDSQESDSDEGLYESSDDEDYVPEGASADDDYDDEDDDYTTKKGKIKARCKGKQKKGQQKQIRNKIRNLPTRRSARKRNKGLCLREQDSEEESDASLEDVDVDDADVEKFDPEYPNEGSKQMEESTKRVDEIWSAMKEEGQLRKDEKPNIDDNETKTRDLNLAPDRSIGKKICTPSKEGSVPEMISKPSNEDHAIAGDSSKVDVMSLQTSAPVGKKRAGGLSDLVGSIIKKQKIGTLEKSKLDWENFKKNEGLEDELKNNSKDGYLSRQEFLQRVDYRTWENEREIRLATGCGKKLN